MSTVTAVPLQPVKRGYLIWLWIGIALALVAAVALARQAPAAISLRTIKAGHGPMPTDNDVVLVAYTGKLANGTVFDQSPQPVPFPVKGVVPGFSEGLKKMQRGGRYHLVIPPQLGYGATPPPGAPIPPNATLSFDVDLIDFKSEAEIRQMQMMQSALGGMQGAPQPH